MNTNVFFYIQLVSCALMAGHQKPLCSLVLHSRIVSSIGQIDLQRHYLLSRIPASLQPEFSQGRVVRKPVNVNPGLIVNYSIIFSYLKIVSHR